MEEKTTKQRIPTTDRDVTAVDDPKRSWTKPAIRIMSVSFTNDGSGAAQRMGAEPNDPDDGGSANYVPS